jgi:hypothetical protein
MADVRCGIWTPPVPAVAVAASGPAEERTFHQLASDWFAMIEPESESTVDAIRWRLYYVLLPFFQHHRLSEITVAEVDRYRAAQVRERDRLAAARKRGEEIDRRPLSNGTINRTIGLLAQILDVSVEYGHGEGERRKLKAEKSQRPYLDSAAQITALLDAAGDPDRGSRADRQHRSRPGSARNIDLRGTQDLRAAFVALAGRGSRRGWITVAKSKTDAGRRKVKIRPMLRDVCPTSGQIGHAWPIWTATSSGPPRGSVRIPPTSATAFSPGPSGRRTSGYRRPVRLRCRRSRSTGCGDPSPRCCTASGKRPRSSCRRCGSPTRRSCWRSTPTQKRLDDGENDRLKALVEGAPTTSPRESAGLE